MSIFYIYLRPYPCAGKTRMYCGYTNDAKRRNAEHDRERRYHWCGEQRVITTVYSDVAGAMAEERKTKARSAAWKRAAYYNAGLKP